VGEPALAPHRRYDLIDPKEDVGLWAGCAVMETIERLRAFSTFFSGTEALSMLERLSLQPFYCAEMERRRQLVRLREGLQRRSDPHPLLQRLAADNLNPQLWAAGLGPRLA